MHTTGTFKNHTLCAISVVGALLGACSDDSSNVGKVGPGGSAGASSGGASGGPTTATGAGTSTGGASTASTGTIGVTGTTGGGGAATTAASTTGTAGTTGSAGSGGTGSGGAGMAGSGGGTDGGCEPANIDTDMDGTPDCAEECYFDKNKTVPGICGCGFVDNDSDGDSKIDCIPGKFYEAENGQLSSSDAGTNDPDASTASGGFTIGMETAASNGRYILAPAGNSEGQPGSAHASYDFNITKADVYGIWGRFYSPDPAHDCFWARMDGGIWTKWRNTTGAEWFWYLLHKEGNWMDPLTFTLTVGHHAFEIANCTDNTKLDRLYVGAGGERPPAEVTTCNPPHTVAINSLCVSSCGQLGGTSCDPATCAGKVLLPAYDCTVCCNPSVSAPDGGDTGADAATDAGAADTATE